MKRKTKKYGGPLERGLDGRFIPRKHLNHYWGGVKDAASGFDRYLRCFKIAYLVDDCDYEGYQSAYFWYMCGYVNQENAK